MQKKTLSSMGRLGGLGLLASALGLSGCGVHVADTAPIVTPGVAFSGSIHGGQQPVSNSTIQIYAASTGGYGAASYALLANPVVSDANGNFTITGQYTCPSSTSQVYLIAAGGNPGAGVNSALSMMTALGSCGNLTPSTFVSINELTTIATVYALAPFMTGYANVGTSATNVQGLTTAFATAGRLVNLGIGQLPGALPAGAAEPTSEINTLADILASCINSTGPGSSQCTTLFANATPTGGTAPTDTVMAALDIAKNPSHNASALFNLATATSPFQPTLTTAPSDFTLSIKYKATLYSPTASAIDATGNVWVTNGPTPNGNTANTTANSLSVFGPTGIPQAGSPYTTGVLDNPSGIAIDASGNAWVTNRQNFRLSVFTPAGVGTSTNFFTLSAPTSISIDGQGFLWITNQGDNSVSKVTVSGANYVSDVKYTGLNAPAAVAISPF